MQVNTIGLCIYLKQAFPNPTSKENIQAVIIQLLTCEPPASVYMDVAKALALQWKRNGWKWNERVAFRTDENEDVFFHENGISFVKEHPVFSGKVEILPIKYGSGHDKVVWF
jgi:hypothetical protein